MKKINEIVHSLSILFCMIFVMTSCGKKYPESATFAGAPVASKTSALMLDKSGEAGRAEGATSQSLSADTASNALGVKRYIALNHHITVETSAKNMQASFDAAVKHCKLLNCQMLSSNYSRETQYNPPSASMTVRVSPKDVDLFLTDLAKNGEIVQHGRDAEDKTDQVVDADAKIKNLTNLRDRLRTMLGDKSAQFADLIQVERELANTQSELDAIAGVRKVLAQETEMEKVDVLFNATQGITEQGFFSPVLSALKNSGQNLMEGMGSVITFIFSALPWIIIGFPLFILVRKLWVKARAKWS